MRVDDEPGGLDPSGGASCAVCGRAIELTGRGLGGTPGLGSGRVVDNRAVCKSCEAGRYRQRAKGSRGRR